MVPAALHRLRERLRSSAVGYRLARGTFWSFAGGLALRVLTMLAAVLVARILGKERFGDFGILQTTVAMFAIFAGFGMGMTSTKYVAEFRARDRQRVGRIIALSEAIAWVTSLSIALVTFFAAPWLARQALRAPQLAGILRLGSLILFLNGINGAQIGVLAGFESFKRIALANLVSGLGQFSLLTVGAWFGGLYGAVCGLVLASLMGWSFTQMLVRRELTQAVIPLWVQGWTKEWKVLFHFSFPLVASSVMVIPVNWLCTAMLFRRPNGSLEMGAFSAANQWYTALLFLPNMLGQSVLPILAERLGAADSRRSHKLLRLSMGLNSLVMVPILILGLASPWIMGWYGREFRGDWATLCIMLATAGLLAVQMPVGQVIIASGRIWAGFFMNVGWAVVYLVGSWWWVGDGAAGVASARLTAYVVHAGWTFWFAHHLLTNPCPGTPRGPAGLRVEKR